MQMAYCTMELELSPIPAPFTWKIELIYNGSKPKVRLGGGYQPTVPTTELLL